MGKKVFIEKSVIYLLQNIQKYNIMSAVSSQQSAVI
jgi:hypothetical protein